MAEQQVAQIIVNSIINSGAKVVYGIPGAKVLNSRTIYII
jgi:thiamine pyrophosphate-dependent acetolactate synthase large subunit-like protein